MKISVLRVLSFEFLKVILQILHETKTYLFAVFPNQCFQQTIKNQVFLLLCLPGDGSLNIFAS